MYNESTVIVAFPIFLWIGGFALTGLQAYVQIVQMEDLKLWLPVNMSIGPGIILIPFWASAIILNIYATCTCGLLNWQPCLCANNIHIHSSIRNLSPTATHGHHSKPCMLSSNDHTPAILIISGLALQRVNAQYKICDVAYNRVWSALYGSRHCSLRGLVDTK